MKKLIVLAVVVLMAMSLLADDFQKPYLKTKEMPSVSKVKNVVTREVPAVEFEVDPVNIIVSFFDYMPGSYCSNPLQLQPEISQPHGYQAGGLYAAFHVTENSSANAQRREFYAFINSAGELVTRTTITNTDTREGYAGIDIDYVTGNPIVAWHADFDENDGQLLESVLRYDLYHVMTGPGLWSQSFVAIDNPEDSEEHTGHDDDEFIWPRIKIGPSPIEGKRRVYIMGNNATDNSNGVANYNILAGYADFDHIDLENNTLEFTLFSFPEWDNLHYNDINRVIKEYAVSDDGQVAFVAYYGHTWCMQYSDDYGETFTQYEASARYDLPNPQNEDGSFYFMDDDEITPSVIYGYPNSDGGHFNAFFADDNSKVVAMGAFGINSEEGLANGTYMPAMFYPKIYNFALVNGELEVDVVDLYIEGVNPNDGIPMVPWDLDEDGEVDEYTEDGKVGFVASVPSWSFFGDNQDAFFHESNFKLSINGNWIIAVWQDAEGVYFNYYEEPGYEEWAEKPEIAVAVSGDYGVTWSQPAFLNANTNDENFYTELDGMIPAYVYAGDQLEVIDDYHAKLHLFFMNDYSYGAFAGQTPQGANEGGMISYAALNVEMPEVHIPDVSTNDKVMGVAEATLLQNYPNPFNPETTIGFNMKEAGNVSIEVFNMKGQKVKTLVNNRNYPTGYNSEIWNGKNNNNKPVSSGIYFYKLKTNSYSTVKRMILMK